jgi:hypothetical protein
VILIIFTRIINRNKTNFTKEDFDMRNFKELKDNEKEEIAKQIALQITERNHTHDTSNVANTFIDAYDLIINEFLQH